MPAAAVATRAVVAIRVFFMVVVSLCGWVGTGWSGTEGGRAGLAVGRGEGDGVRRVAGVARGVRVEVDLAVLVGRAGAGGAERGVTADDLDVPRF